jgi:hypothetical protein
MTFHIQPDPAIIRTAFYGDVTHAEFLEYFKELMRVESGFERTPDRLTDLSGVKGWEPGFPAMLDVTRLRRVQTFPNKFRSAIVATSTELYGLARMFQMLNDNPQIEVQLFKTMAEAEDWLASKT